VVFEVAELEGVDSIDLPPLFGAIDPEALDGLFSGRSAPDPGGRSGSLLTVGFVYFGYRITVWSDGSLLVERLVGSDSSDSRCELRAETVSSERLYGSDPSSPE
jgi:hypothetical protein